MPLVTLKEDFQGYKAGAQRVPEHVYRAARQADVLTTADATTETQSEAQPQETDPLAAFPALTEAGYTVESVRAASDEELLAVKGIGPATLKDIRAAVAEAK